jgi:hypothetical protein
MTTAAGRTTDIPGRRRIDLAKEFGRVKGYDARRPLFADLSYGGLNARRRMHARSLFRGKERGKKIHEAIRALYSVHVKRATALLLCGAMHTNSVIYGHYRICILSEWLRKR